MGNLPPLPEPIWGYSTNTPKFTADQMHEYAIAVMAQTGEEPVAIALHTGTKQGIKWLAKTVEHGTKLYDAPQPAPPDDMKVYDAIAANYTAVPLPAREPLTEAQVLRLFNGPGVSASDRFKINAAMFVRFWRLFEAVNGITATPADKEQP